MANWEEITHKFKVSQEIFEQYKQFYDKNIQPRIQKKHLADLLSVVEDMINEKISGNLAAGIEKNSLFVKNVGRTQNFRLNIYRYK